jgi:hypothetical protein
VLEISPKLIRDRFPRRPRERAERARVEVRDVLEDGNSALPRRTSFDDHVDRRVVGQPRPVALAALRLPRVGPDVSSSPRTSTWSIPGPGWEKPHSSETMSSSVRERSNVTLKSPATAIGSSGRASPST